MEFKDKLRKYAGPVIVATGLVAGSGCASLREFFVVPESEQSWEDSRLQRKDVDYSFKGFFEDPNCVNLGPRIYFGKK